MRAQRPRPGRFVARTEQAVDRLGVHESHIDRPKPCDVRSRAPARTGEGEAAEAESIQPDGLRLYTPAAAAEVLAVRESWLRRKATARQVPCTFLGKHLRFSHADLLAITAAAARPALTGRTTPRPRRRHRF